MDEFATVARLFAPLAAGEAGALGLLDDAAILVPSPGQNLVVTKDVIIAGVHYLPDDPPALVAKKLLRVNLSDLAAMAARPRAYLLGLALSRPVDLAWLAAFAAGLDEDQAMFGVTLIGGDTTAHDGPTVLSLTAIGEVAEGRDLRRGGAKSGDRIWVSGTLGDAALGLRVLRGELSALAGEHRSYLRDRYHLPVPRVDLGRRLVGLANAAIDVSDGLLADLGHICDASGLAATVSVDAVPLSPAARAALAADPGLADEPLTGGDDYELLFTAPSTADAALAGLPFHLTAIGTMGPGSGVALVDATGCPRPVPAKRGWTHF